MYCISDPSINTEKYGYPDSFHDDVRPLSCPIKSLSLIIPLETRNADMTKENLDFGDNQHWRGNKGSFETKGDTRSYSEVPLKNNKSNENVKKIIYYQTCSQASFEYPYFHAKDSFQSDASTMLMFCSSPEEVSIDFKEPKDGFNIWMDSDHKEDKEHQKKAWAKCCTNDWFEHGQHFAFQHPCETFGDYGQKDVSLEKNNELNNPHFLPEQMFTRFNANVYTACEDKPFSFGKEVKNEFFGCFNKEHNNFERTHEKEKNSTFAPFFSPFIIPRRTSRSSHNNDHSTHMMAFPFLQHPQHFCNHLFCSQSCKQPFCKKSKKGFCSLNSRLKNKTPQFTENVYFNKKGNIGKESWAMKYRRFAEKECCRKTGLCFKCRAKMMEKGVSEQKRRPSIKVKKRNPLFVPGQAYKTVECNVSKIFAKIFNDKEMNIYKQKNTHEKKSTKTGFGKCDSQLDGVDVNDMSMRNKSILNVLKTSLLNNKPEKSYYIQNLCPNCDNEDQAQSFAHNFGSKFPHDYCLRNDALSRKNSLMSDNFLKFQFKNNKAFKDAMNGKPFYNIKSAFDLQGNDMMVFEDPSVNEIMKNYENEIPCKCSCNPPLEKCYHHKTYFTKKPVSKKRLNSKLPLLRELSKIERETRNLENQLKIALLRNESLEQTFKDEIARGQHDESDSLLSQYDSEKTLRNLQYEFHSSKPHKYKKKDSFRNKKRLYNKLVKSRTRAESVLKKVSRNMGKVEKVVNNFGGKGNFPKNPVDLPRKKTPVVTPRNQFNKIDHPTKFLIQKPNLRAVVSKHNEPDMSFYHNFQNNNHFDSENEKDSFHHFFDKKLLPKEAHFSPQLTATNFCNHSHHIHCPNVGFNCVFNFSDCPLAKNQLFQCPMFPQCNPYWSQPMTYNHYQHESKVAF